MGDQTVPLVKHRGADTFGLPGKVTPISLTLPRGLSYEQTAEALRLIGGIGRASPWWAADALLYAEESFGEGKFSQLAEELQWAPKTMSNALWVARAWPPKRRREVLDFGHHDALAALEDEDQEHWAALAEAGDKLPNGEVKRWSVTRLRSELRALNPKKEARSEPQARSEDCVQETGAAVSVGPAATGMAHQDHQPEGIATAVPSAASEEQARCLESGPTPTPPAETSRSASTAEGASAARDRLAEIIKATAKAYPPALIPADLDAGCRAIAAAILEAAPDVGQEPIQLAKGMLVRFAGPSTFRVVGLYSSPGEVIIKCVALAAVEQSA